MIIVVETIFFVVFLLASHQALNDFGSLSEQIRQQWLLDYQVEACGRLAAMDANLDGARQYVLSLFAVNDFANALETLEQQAMKQWQEAYASSLVRPCEANSAARYRLFREENDALPALYPNWWVRWELTGEVR